MFNQQLQSAEVAFSSKDHDQNECQIVSNSLQEHLTLDWSQQESDRITSDVTWLPFFRNLHLLNGLEFDY